MLDFRFNNGVRCNETLRPFIGNFLLTLQTIYVPGTIICATCFSDNIIDEQCSHCSELILYIEKYSSARRGQKPRLDSKLSAIDANGELSINTLLWPPKHLTHSWEHQRKTSTILLKKYNPITIYDGFIESILIALVLHHELGYNPFNTTDIPYFFKKDTMLTLCSVGFKQTEFLDIYDRFLIIFSSSECYVAELFQFICLQFKFEKGHTSDPYKGWLWSKKMILSLLPEAAHIFIEFNELLNGTFTIDNINTTSHTAGVPVDSDAVAPLLETEAIFPKTSNISSDDMTNVFLSDDKDDAEIDGFLEEIDLEEIDSFLDDDIMAFGSPVRDQMVIESDDGSTPITTHPGMATFRYKVLQTKEYVFLDRRFKSLVEEITTESYKLAETLVMLAAQVFGIDEPNLDRVCAIIFERKIVVCDENIQMETIGNNWNIGIL